MDDRREQSVAEFETWLPGRWASDLFYMEYDGEFAETGTVRCEDAANSLFG